MPSPEVIRGSLNDWATSLPLQRVAPRRYAASTPAARPAARVECNIASHARSTVDLGGRTPVAIALAPPTLLCFELDATDDSVARLRVSGVR